MRTLLMTTYPAERGDLGGAAWIDRRLRASLSTFSTVQSFPVGGNGPDGVPLQIRGSKPALARVALRVVTRREPYQAAKFRMFATAWSRAIRNCREAAAAADAVVASGWPALLLAHDAGVPVTAYVAHNEESRLSELFSPRLLRLLGDPGLVARLERTLLVYADAVYCISSADLEMLRIVRDCGKLPLGITPADRRRPGAPITTIGFLGSMGWPPNHADATMLINDIAPAVRERAPGVTFAIGGVGSDKLPDRGGNVDLLGWVRDLDDYYRDIGAVVLPRFGGSTGISIKALEAWEHGIGVHLTADVARAFGLAGEGAASPAELVDSLVAGDGTFPDASFWHDESPAELTRVLKIALRHTDVSAEIAL